MTQILAGTSEGVFLIADGRAVRDGTLPSARFLVAAADGVYAIDGNNALWRRTADGGWDCINQRAVEDEVWALGADPRLPGRLYLGVSPALVYRSDDGGATWTAADSIKRIPGYETWTFPPPPHVAHVRSIAPDPAVAGAVYIGVEEGGIFRSPDGGDTWDSLNDGLYWDVHTVTPAASASRLYATTGRGFYRSDDGGQSWRHPEGAIDRGYTVTFTADPSQPDRIFTAAAATPPPGWRNGANVAIYRSDDGGDTWQRLTAGLPERFDRMVLSLIVRPDGSVYASSGGAIYASADRGDTWSGVAEGLPPISALLALE